MLGSADETSVAHLAPEVLLEGIAGQAADVYAFGLILWELATQKHVPLRAMSLLEVQVAVCREGTRPTFPSTIPEDYVRLANQCWSQLPTARPTFSEIALRLQVRGHECSAAQECRTGGRSVMLICSAIFYSKSAYVVAETRNIELGFSSLLIT